jgi:hypothetical protein
MTLTLRSILLLIAVVLFLLDALGLNLGGLDTIALGLALFAAAFVVPDTALGTAGGGLGARDRYRDRDRGDRDLDPRT